MKKSIFFPT